MKIKKIAFTFLFVCLSIHCKNNVHYTDITFAEADYCFYIEGSRLILVQKNNNLTFRLPRKKLLIYKGPCFQEVVTTIEFINDSNKFIVFDDIYNSYLGGTSLYSVATSDGFISPDHDTIPTIPTVLRIDSPPEYLFARSKKVLLQDLLPIMNTFAIGHTTVFVNCWPESDTLYTPDFDTTYTFSFRARITKVCDKCDL